MEEHEHNSKERVFSLKNESRTGGGVPKTLSVTSTKITEIFGERPHFKVLAVIETG